jgi:glutathione S-transferase
LFVALVRTPPAKRDQAAIAADARAVGEVWRLLDHHLSGRRWVEGEQFSLADIVLGAYARRWFGVEGIERPALPALTQWYQGVAARPAFQRHLGAPLT